ncbi:MAG: NAD(P)/FAD-dependent oxidoreductase [Sandaracinaceae bacterium]
MRVVIIGNGVAGIEAALTVRNREPSWDISIVSEESDHFFSRTALMWVVSGQLSHGCIEPHDRDLYTRMNFTRVRARAVGVDAKKRQVRLAGGLDPLPYDRLLIACGSRPRPGPWAGSDLAGVGHFVTMQDLEWLETELHGGPNQFGRPPRPDHHLKASVDDSPYQPRTSLRNKRGGPPKAPVVIGGGLIGIEAIEVMAANKLSPRFFIREEWFWPMAINQPESTWITERMREHGVHVHLEENVEALEGDDALTHIRTDKDTYDADLCVIAIGVVPNTDWLRPASPDAPHVTLAERGGAILVDAGLETNLEGVFAAGDCAAVTWYDGQKRPEQLWYTGRDQGRLAGRRLCGERAEYARGLFYNSAKLMDIEYTTAGFVNMGVEGEQNWFHEETGSVRSTTRIVVAGGAVVGFNLLGRRWDHTILNRWIQERRSLEYTLSHLNEARFDTEFVPPLVVPGGAPTLTGPSPTRLGPTPVPVPAG